MSFRKRIFIIGTCVVSLLILAVFLFVPKEKDSLIIEESLSQPSSNLSK